MTDKQTVILNTDNQNMGFAYIALFNGIIAAFMVFMPVVSSILASLSLVLSVKARSFYPGQTPGRTIANIALVFSALLLVISILIPLLSVPVSNSITG